MNREEKQQEIEHLRQVFQGSVAGVLTGFRGQTVEEVNKLRSDLRKAGVSYQVIKNSLAKKAIAGTELADLAAMLEGPTALAYTAADAAVPAKILKGFCKDTDKVTVKGGYVDGKLFGAADLDRIASLPTRDEARATVLGLFNGVPRGLVTLFHEVPSSFVRVLEARRTELEKGAPEAAA
ncbi:MAG: 50S ribosomal protein L10 [Myxococcota bacterium]|nr:50S ribosomal protein L10 [Myxococcota bacterium]